MFRSMAGSMVRGQLIRTTGPMSWGYQNLQTRLENTMKVEIVHCPT